MEEKCCARATPPVRRFSFRHWGTGGSRRTPVPIKAERPAAFPQRAFHAVTTPREGVASRDDQGVSVIARELLEKPFNWNGENVLSTT